MLLRRVGFVFFCVLSGCTSSSESPSSPEPCTFDLAIDEAHVTVPESPPVVVIAPRRGAAPYVVKLRAASRGREIDVTYTVLRMSNADDGAALLSVLGPPPGVDGGLAVPAAPSAQRLDGRRTLTRGEEIVLGEGVWPDGQPYRVRLTAR